MMDLAPIDVVFIAVVVFTTIRAGIRGFVRELLSMAAVILGIGCAVLFSGIASLYIDEYFGASVWSQVTAFLALFILVYIVVKIFEAVLNALIEKIHLDNLDHALGFLLGIAEGLVLVFVSILIIQIQPFIPPQHLIGESVLARVLLPLLPFAAEFIHARTSDV
jgi:membrane protein required for colicin V production